MLLKLTVCQFGLPQRPGLSTLTKPVSAITNLFTKQFADFKGKFNKVYDSPEEEKKRLEIFAQNSQKLLDLEKAGPASFVMKLNHLADLVLDEFNKFFNGLRADRKKSKGSNFVSEKEITIPKSFDWRTKGAVTSSRYQAQCASCYAFAAAAAIESHNFIKTGKLETISPQNIVDCTKIQPYQNFGCQSGAVDPSFDYIKDNGINAETAYPYLEKDGTECKFKANEVLIKVKGYVLLDEGDEKGLEESVATKGPVVVGIDAGAESFQFYAGGNYYEPKCGNSIERLNHAVLLVGYTPESWIIKNSYGPQWGENGYAKISRNVTNPCGIATYALYPIL